MQLTNSQIYATWYNEIELTVKKVSNEQATIESMKESLIRIAKAKSSLTHFTLDICWKFDNKYYTEKVTV